MLLAYLLLGGGLVLLLVQAFTGGLPFLHFAGMGLVIAGIALLVPGWAVIPIIVGVGAFSVVSTILTIRRVRNIHVAVGGAALVGKQAVARTPLAPAGVVFVQGERWQAVLDEGAAAEGDRVEIVAAEGLTLRVKRVGQ